MKAELKIPRGWRRVVSGKVREGDRLFMTGDQLQWVLAEKHVEIGRQVMERYCVIRKAAKKGR